MDNSKSPISKHNGVNLQSPNLLISPPHPSSPSPKPPLTQTPHKLLFLFGLSLAIIISLACSIQIETEPPPPEPTASPSSILGQEEKETIPPPPLAVATEISATQRLSSTQVLSPAQFSLFSWAWWADIENFFITAPALTTTMTLSATPTLSHTAETTAAVPLPDPATAVPLSTATPIVTPTNNAPDPVATIVAQSCPRREACFYSPHMNSIVGGTLNLRGAATRPGFDYYKLEYQLDGDTEWILLDTSNHSVSFGRLGGWDTTDLPNGVYWLRLVVVDFNGNYWPEESKIRLLIFNEPKPPLDPLKGLRYDPTATTVATTP